MYRAVDVTSGKVVHGGVDVVPSQGLTFFDGCPSSLPSVFRVHDCIFEVPWQFVDGGPIRRQGRRRVAGDPGHGCLFLPIVDLRRGVLVGWLVPERERSSIRRVRLGLEPICHGNKTGKLILWSTSGRILLQKIKHV